MGERQRKWRWFNYTRDAFSASTAIIKVSDFTPPVSSEGCPSIVAVNSEDGGSRPSVGALFMLLVNWPAAVCSREIAQSLKYTSSSQTAGLLLANCRFPKASLRTSHCLISFHIIYNSTAMLCQCLCFPTCYILYQIELYGMHSMRCPTCSHVYFQ